MDKSGWLLIFSVILLSGVIAYLGDILGRRIGKRKLSLLTLRPRYTAILISIVTGVLIAGVTLAILSLASRDVRTALFGMVELKQQLEDLNRQVLERNVELENTRKTIADYQAKVAELEAREKELQTSKITLEEQAKVLEKSVKELETQRKTLQEEVQTLQVELSRLRANIMAIRQGEIAFQDEEEILRVVVSTGLKETEARDYLMSLIARADPIAASRGAGMDREGRGRVFVLEENFAETVKKIVESTVPLVIRLISSLNTLRGEPVIARFVTVENRRIFTAGEVILRKEVSVEAEKTKPEVVLGEILRELNVLGIERGVLPQEGKVGSISVLNLTEVTRALESKSGKVVIEAVAEGDIFTVGPMRIYLRVKE
ncbi:MAG: DUF3084 domain-containing protein [Candidatus Caldatribacteriaceae bacterium]